MVGHIEIISMRLCDIACFTCHVFAGCQSMMDVICDRVYVLNCNNALFRKQKHFKFIWFRVSPDVIQAHYLSKKYILVSLSLLSHVFQDFNFRTIFLLLSAQLLLTQTRTSIVKLQIRQDQNKRIQTRRVLHTRLCCLFQRIPLTYHGQDKRHGSTSMVEPVHQQRPKAGTFKIIVFGNIRLKRVHIVWTHIDSVRCCSDNNPSTASWLPTLKSYPWEFVILRATRATFLRE